MSVECFHHPTKIRKTSNLVGSFEWCILLLPPPSVTVIELDIVTQQRPQPCKIICKYVGKRLGCARMLYLVRGHSGSIPVSDNGACGGTSPEPYYETEQVS